MRLLRLDATGVAWKGRTFTTGATGSNILGLACGREVVVGRKLDGGPGGVGELGLLAACVKAGVGEIQVLTSAGHSSLSKAASILGIGRKSVKELGLSEDQPWRLDIGRLEGELKKDGTVSIIAISAGDVNTGGYALEGIEEWKKVRELADTYGAWIHVDGGKLSNDMYDMYVMSARLTRLAMGVFARALGDEPQYQLLKQKTDGIELADSITLDGHKLLNVVSHPLFSSLYSELNNPALRLWHLLHPLRRDPLVRLHQPQRRIPRLLIYSHHPIPSKHWSRKLPPFPCSACLRRPPQRRSAGNCEITIQHD